MAQPAPPSVRRLSVLHKLRCDIRTNPLLYVMLLPVVAYYLVFHYWPMYGTIIAFKDFAPSLGITASPFADPLLKHFKTFFNGPYAGRVIGNTLKINLLALAIGFPAPIIFALLINELRGTRMKRIYQTTSYLPYFISMMVICSMIITFTSSTGVITRLLSVFGVPQENLISKPQYFVPIFVGTNVWQNMGWNSIIYLSALSAIDMELYDAAAIDGAGRLRQVFCVTLPSISHIIILMLILRIGNLLNVGFEKIILLYSPTTYRVADVISSFVYRVGLTQQQFSFSAAVGLFNSLISFLLLVIANAVSRKLSEASLW